MAKENSEVVNKKKNRRIRVNIIITFPVKGFSMAETKTIFNFCEKKNKF